MWFIAHERVDNAAYLENVGAEGGGGIRAVLFCGMCEEGEAEGRGDVPGAMKPFVPTPVRIWPWPRR